MDSSFRAPKVIDGRPPFPLKFALKVTHPFQKFRLISARSASTVKAGEKGRLTLIGSRPRAFQRAIDEPSTLPLSPTKEWHKMRFCYFFQ